MLLVGQGRAFFFGGGVRAGCFRGAKPGRRGHGH